MSAASCIAKLRIKRGSSARSGRSDHFEVPYEDGMSVLDALRWTRVHLDSSLAIRYSCINANACKTLRGARERRSGIHLHRQN